MCSCILCQFPDEIKLKIWQYLNSSDIINIEIKNIFNCNCTRNVSSDYSLIRKLDITGEYSLGFAELKQFVKPRSDLITHFNINFMYWVPKGVLVNAIIQMKQLKYLNALDTKLRYENLKEIEHEYCKIEKVAVSLHTVPIDSSLQVISQVNVLFYYVGTHGNELNFLDGLEKLKRSEFKCSNALSIDTENVQFLVYHANRTNNQNHINMVNYDDQNPDTTIQQVTTVNGCMHKMTRVGKSLCAYYCHIVGDFSCDNSIYGLKDIFDQLPDIEDLFIWNCQQVTQHATSSKSIDQNLMVVTRLGRLKTITLDTLPIYIPGTFFNYILTQCKNLRSLKVCFGNYLPPLRKMYSTLHMCTSLKTLCVKYNHVIDCAELLSVLLKCTFKLERLVIQVFDLRNLRGKDVHTFFAANSQLKFVYFVVKDMPQAAMKNIMKIFKAYSIDPQRIYKISAGISLKNGKDLIPSIHFLETLCAADPTLCSVLDGLHNWLHVD